MTAAQARAISRAQQANIRILARGTVKATGQAFYVTTSRDGRGSHVVLVGGASLSCDCQAGQRGILCCHRAAVHTRLMSEASARPAAASATVISGHVYAPVVTLPARPTQPDAVRACERTFDIFKPADRRAQPRVREAY